MKAEKSQSDIFPFRGVAVATLIVLALVLSACGDLSSETEDGIVVHVDGSVARIRTERITQAAWGDKWPFTVGEATLICVQDLGLYGQFYTLDGYAFGANGASQTMARIKSITVTVGGHTMVPGSLDGDDPVGDRLWALSPPSKLREGDVERAWLARVNVGTLIDALTDLGCRD